MCRFSSHRGDRGQATIAMVGVIAMAVAAAVVLSVFGEAMVHRARARNAADAVALAAAIDSDAADALESWYADRQVLIERTDTQTTARSGPSQAAAWASTQPSSNQPAPALVAIIARAEQLLDTVFAPVHWHAMTVTLTTVEAVALRAVAIELGLCETQPGVSEGGFVDFELC